MAAIGTLRIPAALFWGDDRARVVDARDADDAAGEVDVLASEGSKLHR